MSNAPHIIVKPASGISPEEACVARARAWAFVFESFHRHAKEKGGPETAPNDAMKGSKHDRASSNCT